MEPPRELLATLRYLPSHALSEREISLLWKFILPRLSEDSGLSTDDGTAVEVVDPGSVGHREGPDVSGTTVRIGETKLTGDVEIHGSPADWYHHGHHRDPGFNNVVLQVCIDPVGDSPARREDGRFIDTVALTSVYQSCLEKLDEWLDGSSADRVRAVKRPCYVPDGTVPDNLHDKLDRAGQGWLCHRASRLRSRDLGERLFESMVGALGYTRNHETFLEMAEQMDPSHFYRICSDESPCEMEAWLMGKGGWLDRPFENKVNRTIYRRRRSWETKWSSESPVVESHRWNHSGIRPQAFPLRRWIWFGYATRHLKGTWRDWMETQAKSQLKQNSIRTPLARSLLSMFHLDSTRYWSTHYTRSDDVHDGAPEPVGAHWMDQLLVNVVLPWFYSRALESGDGTLSDRVMRHLRRYPPVLSNRRTRRMKRQWGLEGSFQWENVLEQQAAVFLYKHGCVVDRCGQCSFNRREDDQLRLIDRRR